VRPEGDNALRSEEAAGERQGNKTGWAEQPPLLLTLLLLLVHLLLLPLLLRCY